LAEFKLLRRAIRERWPIPAGKRGPLVKRLLEMLATTEDPRSFLHGFRALVEADKVNLASEAQALAWLAKQPPEGDGREEEPTREVVVRTREEAAAVLSALSQAGGLP
jgi:hypothetical protein